MPSRLHKHPGKGDTFYGTTAPSLDDPIESGPLATCAEGVELNIDCLRNMLTSATSFQEFRRGIFEANRSDVHNDTLPRVRGLRAHALAVVIQAYSFGVIIDDVSVTHVDDSSWQQMIEDFFDGTVSTPGVQCRHHHSIGVIGGTLWNWIGVAQMFGRDRSPVGVWVAPPSTSMTNCAGR